jgi:ankyrin repeat protein
MIENEEDLPNDIPSLKSLVLDLSRRLQNAQHTIEAERKTTQIALHQAADYRLRLSETVQTFRLESSRLKNIEYKTSKQLEAQKFEDNKSKGTKLYEKAKYAELDHQMTGLTKIVPLKLTKLRDQLKSFEDQQNNLKLLLQHYAEIDEMNNLFMNCVQHNQIDDCIQLLHQGVDVNYVDTAGYLAIHYACSQGYYDIAQLLLQHGSDHSSYLTGYAPIVLAAKQGYVNIIRLLLEFGADIEEKGRLGTPAVIAALENQQYATVEFLIVQGANIHTYDFQENNLLHTLCKIIPTGNDHLAITGVGYTNPTTNPYQATNLLLTMNNNISNFFQYLLELGIDVQCVNKMNHTPLQVALYAKNSLAISILNDWFQKHPELTGQQPQQTTPFSRGDGEDQGLAGDGDGAEGTKHLSASLMSGSRSRPSKRQSTSTESSVSSASAGAKVRQNKASLAAIQQRQAIFTSRAGKVLPVRVPPNASGSIPPGQQPSDTPMRAAISTSALPPISAENNQKASTTQSIPSLNNNQQELKQSQHGMKVVSASEVIGLAGAVLEEDELEGNVEKGKIPPHTQPHTLLHAQNLLANHSVSSSVTFDP